jgi:hypothetical protein
MPRNNHFYDQVHMLGVTQNIYPSRDQGFRQILAEDRWGKMDAKAGQTISERGAKDLVGETLHHSAMDEIPGVEYIRNNFNPETDVQLTAGLPNATLGQLESTFWGNHLMKLGNTSETPLRTHIVTHELSHLLSHPVLSNLQYADPKNSNNIGHSWAMARAHIHATRTALGNEAADNLRSIYRAYGVGFGRKVI